MCRPQAPGQNSADSGQVTLVADACGSCCNCSNALMTRCKPQLALIVQHHVHDWLHQQLLAARLSQPSKTRGPQLLPTVASCNPSRNQTSTEVFHPCPRPYAAMAEDDSSRSWSELPVSVLTFAFEKLDLRERAGTINCIALVCTSWAAAAAAATRSTELSRCTNTDSLQQWLRSRGSHVSKVRLRGARGLITSLPCPRLKELVLEDLWVDLRPGSQLLQDLSAATTLEHLHLDEVMFQGEPDLVAVLKNMPDLQYIHFGNIQVFGSPKQQQQQSPASIATAAHDIHYVTHSLFWSNSGFLHDWCTHITDEGMQFLCKLTKLQSLELHNIANVTAARLAGLHNLPALKRLGLEDLSCRISASAVPALTQLTALTCLKLGWEHLSLHQQFDPSVLAHMTQLEELQLCNADPAGGASGAAELLARLAQLTKLQVLYLAYVYCLLQCPLEALSSLTSSSVLRSLTWRDLG